MLPNEGLLLWNSTRPSRAKKNAFADPLEAPEWQSLLPWLNALGLIKDR